MGTAAGIVAVLIFWCIRNTWDSAEPDEDVDWPYEPEAPVENGLGNGTQTRNEPSSDNILL